ncbi:MAG: bifunctional 5,10-methylenetetrahydrofolate dehydrogenase/5,10-methenyltetrahydrofolate cyclohydrolase [Candidatus Saccharibacteria bacterium]|nr:bifunctional 5,10-methylenetetrahydrofolate dehydrogenase/5,10-methenyltetrahydrofolate cyclohydrolase [Candidatus Saccharibacteria bacterium]
MPKILNGTELADFVKERQAHSVRALKSDRKFPKLVIIRDSDNPVIMKYVELKKEYGSDIGIIVEDRFAEDLIGLKEIVRDASADPAVSGIIVQLPLKDKSWTDEVVAEIKPEKDVDGLNSAALVKAGKHPIFESATATAINWLISGYDINLENRHIAIVGKGRLVGEPLIRMWRGAGHDVTVFDSKSDLKELRNFDLIVTATGKPHIITNEMVKSGAIVIDAGTASEHGILVGDLAEDVRSRSDLKAFTPKVGGVGPLTVAVLFEDVISAAS